MSQRVTGSEAEVARPDTDSERAFWLVKSSHSADKGARFPLGSQGQRDRSEKRTHSCCSFARVSALFLPHPPDAGANASGYSAIRTHAVRLKRKGDVSPSQNNALSSLPRSHESRRRGVSTPLRLVSDERRVYAKRDEELNADPVNDIVKAARTSRNGRKIDLQA